MDVSKLLKDILIACHEKKYDVNITQDGTELVVQKIDDPKCVFIQIPDPADKNVIPRLLKCLESIKTIPS